MKILAVSDIHNDKSLIEKIIEVVKKEKPDFVVLAGDISFFFEEPKDFIGRLVKYIDPKKVLIIPGNHDSPDTIYLWEKKYGIINLHGKTLEFYDFVFVGIGGGNMPPLAITEEEIKEIIEKLKKKIKGKKIILVSHTHPAYSKSEMIGEGSKEIFKFIKYFKPILVIYGHIHEFSGLEEIIENSKAINVARTIVLIEINGEIKIRKC